MLYVLNLKMTFMTCKDFYDFYEHWVLIKVKSLMCTDGRFRVSDLGSWLPVTPDCLLSAPLWNINASLCSCIFMYRSIIHNACTVVDALSEKTLIGTLTIDLKPVTWRGSQRCSGEAIDGGHVLHLGSSKGCHWTEVASLAYRCHQCCLLLHLQVVKKKGKQKVIKVKTCESELSKARQKKHKK